MLRKYKKIKTKILVLGAASITTCFSLLSTVQAACGNRVPSPLNPNCDPAVQTVTLGGLIDRFLGIVPIGITAITVFAVGRGAIKVALASDAEKRGEGFKSLINAGIGAVLFYSIWIILFLISYLTGANTFITK